MHIYGLGGGDNINALLPLLFKFFANQLFFPDEGYLCAQFPNSRNSPPDYLEGSVIAAHCVYKNSHSASNSKSRLKRQLSDKIIQLR